MSHLPPPLACVGLRGTSTRDHVHACPRRHRHLVKLQPAVRHALKAHAQPHHGGAALQQALLFLHQPRAIHTRPGGDRPRPYRHPLLWRPRRQRRPRGGAAPAGAAALPAASHPAHGARAVAWLHQERAEFEGMVAAACRAAAPKLRLFSGGDLSACAGALGHLHVQLSGGFWPAWEAATLPLLLDIADGGGDAEPGGEEDLGVASGVRAEERRKGLLPCHLGGLLAGPLRCKHVPGGEWRRAFWRAAGHAARGARLKLPHLAALCEGMALLALRRAGDDARPGAAAAAPDAAAVVDADERQAMAEVVRQAWGAVRRRLEEPGVEEQEGPLASRFLVAPLLGAAALSLFDGDAQAAAPFSSPAQQGPGDGERAPDELWALASAWMASSMRPLNQQGRVSRSAAAAALWAVGTLQRRTHAAPEQGTGTPAPQQQQQQQPQQQQRRWLPRPEYIWAEAVGRVLLGPGPGQTAGVVHGALVGLEAHVGHWAPTQRLTHIGLRAVRHTLPSMTPQQVADVLAVLSAWGAQPSPSWAASLAVHLHVCGPAYSDEQRAQVAACAVALGLSLSAMALTRASPG